MCYSQHKQMQTEEGQLQLRYFLRQKKLIEHLVDFYHQLKASGKNAKRKVRVSSLPASETHEDDLKLTHDSGGEASELARSLSDLRSLPTSTQPRYHGDWSHTR